MKPVASRDLGCSTLFQPPGCFGQPKMRVQSGLKTWTEVWEEGTFETPAPNFTHRIYTPVACALRFVSVPLREEMFRIGDFRNIEVTRGSAVI